MKSLQIPSKSICFYGSQVLHYKPDSWFWILVFESWETCISSFQNVRSGCQETALDFKGKFIHVYLSGFKNCFIFIQENNSDNSVHFLWIISMQLSNTNLLLSSVWLSMVHLYPFASICETFIFEISARLLLQC